MNEAMRQVRVGKPGEWVVRHRKSGRIVGYLNSTVDTGVEKFTVKRVNRVKLIGDLCARGTSEGAVTRHLVHVVRSIHTLYVDAATALYGVPGYQMHEMTTEGIDP